MPAYGVLRQLNTSTFEYTANPGYAGRDTFSVQVTGKGPTAAGTSVISLVATVR
jgi:Bacterial Ig domain